MSAQYGCLGGEWKRGDAETQGAGEWKVIERDRAALGGSMDLEKILRLKSLDQEARKKGIRVLFVPTFYAWGKK